MLKGDLVRDARVAQARAEAQAAAAVAELERRRADADAERARHDAQVRGPQLNAKHKRKQEKQTKSLMRPTHRHTRTGYILYYALRHGYGPLHCAFFSVFPFLLRALAGFNFF